jgi:hypothetical protein
VALGLGLPLAGKAQVTLTQEPLRATLLALQLRLTPEASWRRTECTANCSRGARCSPLSALAPANATHASATTHASALDAALRRRAMAPAWDQGAI